MSKLIQKSALPDREIAICKRFSEIRRVSGLSQANFAKEIGIPLGSVSNYEYGKTALRADIALRTCYSFLANERWLATGEGSFEPCVDLFSDLSLQMQLKRGELYSTAYDRVLASKHDQLEQLPNNQLILRLLKSEQNTPARLNRIFSYTQHLFGILFGLLKIEAYEKKAELNKAGLSDENIDRLLQMKDADFLHIFYEAGIKKALSFFDEQNLDAKPIIPAMRELDQKRYGQKTV